MHRGRKLPFWIALSLTLPSLALSDAWAVKKKIIAKPKAVTQPSAKPAGDVPPPAAAQQAPPAADSTTTPPSAAPAPAGAPSGPSPTAPSPTSAAPAAAPENQAPSSAAPAELPPAPTGEPEILALVKEGRSQHAAGQLQVAVATFKEASDAADRLPMDASSRAQIHSMYAWALYSAGDVKAGLKEAQRAADLAPSDAELQRDLAEFEYENQEYAAAAASADRAVRMGLSVEDAAEARELSKRARAVQVRPRLRIDAGLSLGFDSNVGQGESYQTIAGKSTRGAAKNQADRLAGIRIFRSLREDPVLGAAVYQRAVTADYQSAQAQSAQAGLPLDLALGVRYRPITLLGTDLWVGYQFAQTFMLFAQSADNNLLPSSDSYHLQRHQAFVSAEARPRPWLDLNARIEGFVTLSGLQGFTPFQGGLAISVRGVVTETERWRTLGDVSYLFRKSFDGPNDGYLDGNRIQLRVGQELNLGWIRPQLAYRFTYDATGVLQVMQPLAIMYAPSNMPTAAPLAADLGTYTYHAPLSYQGHQLSASTSAELPLLIHAQAALRYEYQRYADVYSATYVGNGVGAIAPLPPFVLPEVQREDHRVMFELAAGKDLPHHIGVGLGYALLANFSNIANVLDNRSYQKHSVMASVSYFY